jgi:glutaredoxin 3
MSNDNQMVVWVSEPSVVCARVKAFLDARGYEYEAIQVDDDNARERMLKETGRTTCPLVVVGEVIVGGFEETAAADRSGELRRLVATT